MLNKKLIDILNKVPRLTLIEVGARTGARTQELIMALKDHANDAIRLHVFEADKRMIPLCVQHLPANVGITASAVCHVSGSVPLYMYGDDANPDSSIQKRMDTAAQGEVPVENMASWRLDDYCISNRIQHVDLLIIDNRGADKHVILGGSAALLFTRYVMFADAESGEQLHKKLPGQWEPIENGESESGLVFRHIDYDR